MTTKTIFTFADVYIETQSFETGETGCDLCLKSEFEDILAAHNAIADYEKVYFKSLNKKKFSIIADWVLKFMKKNPLDFAPHLTEVDEDDFDFDYNSIEGRKDFVVFHNGEMTCNSEVIIMKTFSVVVPKRVLSSIATASVV